jgi:hypothetical protein
MSVKRKVTVPDGALFNYSLLAKSNRVPVGRHCKYGLISAEKIAASIENGILFPAGLIMTHVVRFENRIEQVRSGWRRDYPSNKPFCGFPAEMGSRSEIKRRQDSLFPIPSTSHKNEFNDSAHQYDPGDAQGITRDYISQIMIAVEYAAEALKEHKHHHADTQYPFPETRRHQGD